MVAWNTLEEDLPFEFLVEDLNPARTIGRQARALIGSRRSIANAFVTPR